MNVLELECKYTPVLQIKMNIKLFVDNLGFIRIIRIIQLATKFGFGELIFNFSQIYILRQNGPNKMFVFVALPLLFRIILA